MARLTQTTCRLDPAEPSLEALAPSQADRVAEMARGAAIDRRPSAFGVLRDMRRHAQPAHLGDKVRRVVGLVGGPRDALTARQILDHRDGCLAAAGAGRLWP